MELIDAVDLVLTFFEEGEEHTLSFDEMYGHICTEGEGTGAEIPTREEASQACDQLVAHGILEKAGPTSYRATAHWLERVKLGGPVHRQ